MRRKKFHFKVIAIVIFLGGLMIVPLFIAFPKISIILDKSESLPYKFYICSTKEISPKKDNYVLIRQKKTSPFLIKKIGGVQGDILNIRKSHLYINEQLKLRLIQKMSSGKPLTATKYKIIPENFFFVY